MLHPEGRSPTTPQGRLSRYLGGRIEKALLSSSIFEPTELPQTEQRYSNLFPEGRTISSFLRTGVDFWHLEQNNSEASNSS